VLLAGVVLVEAVLEAELLVQQGAVVDEVVELEPGLDGFEPAETK
jgi:hypothetical protein